MPTIQIMIPITLRITTSVVITIMITIINLITTIVLILIITKIKIKNNSNTFANNIIIILITKMLIQIMLINYSMHAFNIMYRIVILKLVSIHNPNILSTQTTKHYNIININKIIKIKIKYNATKNNNNSYYNKN